MTTTDTTINDGLQLAASYCRLRLLGDVESRVALLNMVRAAGPLALAVFVESLAGLAGQVEHVGRGNQPVRTHQELLDFFEDLAAVTALDGAA